MKIATANLLGDGAVVFFGHRSWVRNVDDAFVAQNDAEERGLEAMMLQSEAAQEVVGPYLIEVALHGDDIKPIKFRERIRAAGPTVTPDSGPAFGENIDRKGDHHVSL